LNARSIAQIDAWFVVTTGLPNSRSQGGNRRHRREIAARHHEDLDLGPIDPGECLARVLRAGLSDRVRVGRAESFERDRVEPVVVVLGKQTGRRLGQDHHLDLGRPQQARLIVDVLVPARRETSRHST